MHLPKRLQALGRTEGLRHTMGESFTLELREALPEDLRLAEVEYTSRQEPFLENPSSPMQRSADDLPVSVAHVDNMVHLVAQGTGRRLD
jgi:tRNA U55 pseudouridine synthase TruB